MAEEQNDKTGSSKKALFGLALLGVVILVSSGAGILAARLVGRPGPGDAQAANEIPDEDVGEPPATEEEYDYYEFEPVTVNMDDTRLARYVRAQPILAIKAKQYKVVEKLIETKKRELKNWLITYLMGCTLEEVRGPKNISRIRREIRDNFNDQLHPGGRPVIEQVLFKDFKVH